MHKESPSLGMFILIHQAYLSEVLFLIDPQNLLPDQILEELYRGKSYHIEVLEMQSLPVQQELHLLCLIGSIPDVVQKVPMAVYVDIRNHPTDLQEEVIVLIAQLLL